MGFISYSPCYSIVLMCYNVPQLGEVRDFYPINHTRITNFKINTNMSNEANNPASCQTAVRRRFIPIPYKQWFDSVHNKTKAFAYMSKESFKYYYRWCEYVSKTYA